jgi:hypothetical protein
LCDAAGDYMLQSSRPKHNKVKSARFRRFTEIAYATDTRKEQYTHLGHHSLLLRLQQPDALTFRLELGVFLSLLQWTKAFSNGTVKSVCMSMVLSHYIRCCVVRSKETKKGGQSTTQRRVNTPRAQSTVHSPQHKQQGIARSTQ